MDSELASLCQQANIINLNYIVARNAGDELKKLDSLVGQLETKVAQIRANLTEEAALLEVTSNATREILGRVRNKPLPSALKGNRFQQNLVTPNKATPGKQKAVSFDIRSSPLSLCQAAESPSQHCGNSAVVPLSQFEFDQIPKYMKGRLTVEKINSMIELLNLLYAEKYAVMSQNPNKLPHEHRQKYWDWKEMECEEVQDRCFITEADIKAAMQSQAARTNPTGVFKLDPIGRSTLAILRHFGRIKEVRTRGIVRFVIL